MSEILHQLGKKLNDNDLKSLALKHNVPYASVMAVVMTEALGSGFYKNTAIPIVRLENHKFNEKTRNVFKGSPLLAKNKVGFAEYQRFEALFALNGDAAIWSTSFGMGQTMGFNFAICGYPSLRDFMAGMFESELKQVEAMFAFIEANNLSEAMRNQDWATFARKYNGPLYAKNSYDKKLAKFYKDYSL